MTDKWKQGVDEQGAPCEYNILNGDVRYSLDKDETVELTQDEIDALFTSMSDNPMSPMPTPIEGGELCSDCKGTGEYVGALVVEKCKRCNGLGQI